MRILIKGGRLIDPANDIDGTHDLYIADSHVVAVGDGPTGFHADSVIDASGCNVIPGLIDLRARLREPGQDHKASIESETRAAASGGITTLCLPPDTNPVIDTPAVVELIARRNDEAGYARVMPLGALTRGLKGEQLSEMLALKNAGCVGISNALAPILNQQIMRRAMEYAANTGLTLFIHPEDPVMAQRGCAHEGAVSTRLGLAGIPEAAETMAVAQHLMLVELTGVRTHFCDISTAHALRMIKRAQHDGLPVTCDVTTHHLHLIDIDIGYFDSNCHVRPPLRSQRDREALRQGIADNSISAICSDHQPHDADAKLAPFAMTEPGISGLETLLPLSLRLAEDGDASLSEIIAHLTIQPAEILGLKLGQLGVGSVADVCIYDPQHSWTFASDEMLSAGHNSPFNGWSLKGCVTHTLLGGKLAYELRDIPTL